MDRRSFLKAGVLTGASAYVITAANVLMPVRTIVGPSIALPDINLLRVYSAKAPISEIRAVENQVYAHAKTAVPPELQKYLNFYNLPPIKCQADPLAQRGYMGYCLKLLPDKEV